MASETSPIVWQENTLKIGLIELSPKLNAGIAVIFDREESVAERGMKRDAPWTDRTGNARATLQAKAKNEERKHELTLFGGMPYQIFLETMQAGRFAIITKYVPKTGIHLMEMCVGLIGRMQGL